MTIALCTGFPSSDIFGNPVGSRNQEPIELGTCANGFKENRNISSTFKLGDYETKNLDILFIASITNMLNQSSVRTHISTHQHPLPDIYIAQV